MNDEQILAFDPYTDDCDIKCRVVKIVTTRKEHTCINPATCKIHTLPVGSRARYETAIVDGEWGRYYTCVKCIEEFDSEVRK